MKEKRKGVSKSKLHVEHKMRKRDRETKSGLVDLRGSEFIGPHRVGEPYIHPSMAS